MYIASNLNIRYIKIFVNVYGCQLLRIPYKYSVDCVGVSEFATLPSIDMIYEYAKTLNRRT